MKTVIALSVSDITTRLLALSALRHTLNSSRPPLLHADHRAALELVIHSSFAEICLRLSSLASDCAPGAADDDIMSITLDLPETAAAPPLRGILENATAMATLAEAYRGADASLSASYTSEFTSLISLARRTITDATFAAAPPCIRPHFFGT